MLSIAKVTNTAQAASYYNSPDKYYEKDNADIGSCWGGKGAEDLGLEGTVVSTDFVKMLDGRINESTHLGRVDKEGEIKHVPGWDFTFSAPKSLSILALVGGDSRLVEAHIKASNAAMKHIESSYAKTRIKSDGKNEYVSVDNIIYASFVHTESRKHDPQLHSHNVVMNAVKDSDGQWRSLETLKMYEGKMMAGLVYRSELAMLVKKLGYDIEITDREKAFFDIKGVSDSLMDNFSKRRKEVVAAAKQRGLFDAESMAKATLYSRDSKTHVEVDALHQLWQQTVVDSGVDLGAVIESAISKQVTLDREERQITANDNSLAPIGEYKETVQEQNSTPVPGVTGVTGNDGRRSPTGPSGGELIRPGGIEPDNEAILATNKLAVSDQLLASEYSAEEISNIVADVRLAYKVMAADEAVFDENKVAIEAGKLLIGQASIDDIQVVLNAMINSGELLPRHSRTNLGAMAYTTPEAFAKEKSMIAMMLNGKNERQAIGDQKGIEEYISAFEGRKSLEFGSPFVFSVDQRNAIINAAVSKDLVSGTQGFAGTGKTTLLECLIGYATEQGFTVKGFAPTGSATDTLSREAGIPAKTIDSFLFTRMKGAVNQKELWLVDEASLVGASNMHALIDEARKSGASLHLLGDKKQMESVDWGRPFTVLQQFKMQTSEVTNIIRQKNEPLRQAVYAAIDGNFGVALENIKGNIFNLDEKSITKDFLKLTPEEREKTLVLIPDNESRMVFNEEVHDARVKEGTLPANEIAVRGLISRNLNEAERTDARYYRASDVIEFQTEYGEFKAGEFWRVAQADVRSLKLTNDAGEVKQFDPSTIPAKSKFSIDVFEEKQMVFSPGEKVVFTKSRKDLGVRNGDEFTLSQIDPNGKTFTLDNGQGKPLILNQHGLHNLTHNYAMTSYKAQGKTVDNVMVQLESWRKNLVNERSFYVALSRARHKASLYVDDVGKVQKALSEHFADKTSSLDGVSEGSLKRAAAQLQSKGVDNKQLFVDLGLAVQKLSNKQGVFSHTDLLKETLKATLGTYDVRAVETAIYVQRSRGEIGLSHVNHDKPNAENFYTLPSNIRQESQIVRHMLQGQDRLPAIAGKSVISRYFDSAQERESDGAGDSYNPATKEALLTLLSSRDETVMLTGSDHSGHREVMRGAGRLIAESSGYKVRGFSTNAEGVRQLKESIKSSSNIYYHLEQMEKRVAAQEKLPNIRELWVVENVSQLGAEDLLRLQQVARYAAARLVLVADKQESSLSWGNVPTLLAEQGITTFNFDKSTAALNPSINAASEKLIQGKVDDALNIIAPMITEVHDEKDANNDKNVRLGVLADTYLNLRPDERDKTAIIVPDYFSRNKVDVQIRKGLESQGVLHGQEVKVDLYRNANLDPFEKKQAASYKDGQVIQFESNRPGIEKGVYYTIRSVNKDTNELNLVSHSDGRHVSVDARTIAGSRNNSVQVFHVEKKSLQAGDKIRFTRSTSAEKLEGKNEKSIPSKTNGTIEHIDGNQLHVRLNNGRQVIVDTNRWKHVEWAYTHNMYNVKDRRFENVVTLMESWKKHFSTQEALHNALTKASQNLHIITDNKGKLLDSLKTNPGFRHSALQNKQVSIDKQGLAAFDKQFGAGLTPGLRGLLKVEAAIDKAATTAKTAIAEKTKVVVDKVRSIQRQRSL